tara:strand:+ start:949 stop:2130 length:1182 start_codon:yes stop_codon:yes gene_type:complete
MTVRVPIRYTSDGQIRDMTSNEIEALIIRGAWCYMEDPPIRLSVLANQIDFSNADLVHTHGHDYRQDTPSSDTRLGDQRYTTGTAKTDVSSFPSEATTGEPELVVNQWNRINVINSSDTAGTFDDASNSFKRWPCYRTSDNHIQPMSNTDFFDTIIHPILESISGAHPRLFAPGQGPEDLEGVGYKVVGVSGVSGDGGENTAPSLPGYSLAPGTSAPIFRDTFADQTKYTDGTAAGTIGTANTTQDYFEYVSYWLLRKPYNGASKPAVGDGGTAFPVVMTDDNNLQEMSTDGINTGSSRTNFDRMLNYALTYWVDNGGVGKRLRYEMADGATTTHSILGAIMLDQSSGTVSSGGPAGVVNTLKVNENDYRAQEFPVGTVQTQKSYALVIRSDY